jgi:hypothetical protein
MQNKCLPFLLVVLAGVSFCYGDGAGSDGKEFFSKLSWEKILEGDAEKPTGAPHVPRVGALPEGLAE